MLSYVLKGKTKTNKEMHFMLSWSRWKDGWRERKVRGRKKNEGRRKKGNKREGGREGGNNGRRGREEIGRREEGRK